MVDLHNHLLPALDDGSKDLETTLAMCRIAAADGITHIVATPHANNQFEFSADRINRRLAVVRAALAEEGIKLTLASGCDFHMSYDNLQDAIANPRKYTINAGEYLLTELPDHGLSPHLDEAFYELGLAGMKPILTHPERNPTLQRDPKRLTDWMRIGLLTQITAGSVTGLMGKASQRMAFRLLENRWVHFIATDAHNTDKRSPRMREAHDLIAKKFSPAYAKRICLENPLAAYENRPLSEQDEPRNLYRNDAQLSRRWWQIRWKPSSRNDEDLN